MEWMLRAPMKAIVMATLFALVCAAPAAFPPKPTEFDGTVVACGPKGIIVRGRIGTRLFPIYEGTVFGAGRSQKLADFKPGTYVRVVFSEITGIVKAENIRTIPRPPEPPKRKR